MLKKRLISLLMVASLFVSAHVAFADTGTAHIKIGSINGGASSIPYWYDSSVSAYGYGPSFNNGFTQWDLASTKVGFVSTTSASDAKVKVYVVSNDLAAGVIAETDYWNYNWLGQVTLVYPEDITNGSSYDKARIRFDEAHLVAYGYDAKKVAGHEIGHTLGLNHFENSPAHSGNHWMKSGSFSLSSPTSTDISHLTTKWGS